MDDRIRKFFKMFSNGQYSKLIEELKKCDLEDPRVDHLLFNAFIKANYTDKAIHTGIRMLEASLFAPNQEIFNAYFNFLKYQNLFLIGIRILREINGIKHLGEYYTPEFKKEITEQFDGHAVFPIIWPIAFGDMIVIHQFIRFFKQQAPDKKILVIMPLNRPELKELASMNPDIDRVIDITLLPEKEKDRNYTLSLENKGVLNITIQELMIQELLNALPNANVFKLRYLPVLDGFKYHAGFRIWEERARLHLEDKKYLPRILEQTHKKKNKIVCHFREGAYNNSEGRNVNINYQQDLVNEIKKLYPRYEIVKLGDETMAPLIDVRNACHEKLPLKDQIKEIQEAKLAICTNSSVQHAVGAFSDTPLICFNYMGQETMSEIGDNIPAKSYEPISENVKAIYYSNLFDQEDKPLPPRINYPKGIVARFEHTNMQLVLNKVKEILG